MSSPSALVVAGSGNVLNTFGIGFPGLRDVKVLHSQTGVLTSLVDRDDVGSPLLALAKALTFRPPEYANAKRIDSARLALKSNIARTNVARNSPIPPSAHKSLCGEEKHHAMFLNLNCQEWI